MSFKSWVHKFFPNLFSQIPKWVLNVMPDILVVTKSIKAAMQKGEHWLESETAETIVDIIPSSIDDNIRKALLAILKTAIGTVHNIEDAEKCDLGTLLISFLRGLQWESDKGAKAKLQALSSTMLALKDENKLPENRYDTLSQLAYSKLEGKAE